MTNAHFGAATARSGPSGERPMRVTVYHHTHWDREWWTTRRDFSVRLADLIGFDA